MGTWDGQEFKPFPPRAAPEAEEETWIEELKPPGVELDDLERLEELSEPVLELGIKDHRFPFRRRCGWCGVQLRLWQRHLCRLCSGALHGNASSPCSEKSRWDCAPDSWRRKK